MSIKNITNVLTYITGGLLFAPSLILMSVNNAIAILIGFMWGVIVFVSPNFHPMLKRFWRKWHRVDKTTNDNIKKYLIK